MKAVKKAVGSVLAVRVWSGSLWARRCLSEFRVSLRSVSLLEAKKSPLCLSMSLSFCDWAHSISQHLPSLGMALAAMWKSQYQYPARLRLTSSRHVGTTWVSSKRFEGKTHASGALAQYFLYGVFLSGPTSLLSVSLFSTFLSVFFNFGLLYLTQRPPPNWAISPSTYCKIPLKRT